MDCFLKSMDYDLWYIVVHGNMIHMKKVDGRLIEKTHDNFDKKDKIMISKNAKAKNYLIYGLGKNIYKIVLIKHLVHMKCREC